MTIDVPRLTWVGQKSRPNNWPKKNTPGRKPELEAAIAFQGGLDGPKQEETNEQ